jgi:hypothetical protein
MKVVDLIASVPASAENMSLDIIVGEGQIGAEVIATGSNVQCALGSGPKLVGQVLTTKSAVTDVNDFTNKTSVEYVFRDGRRVQKFLSKVEVDHNGDSVVYRSRFTFV